MRNQQIVRQIGYYLVCQLGVAMVFTFGSIALFDQKAGYSAFLGGLACLLPNVYFAKRVFRYSDAAYVREIVRAFYRGEAQKIAVSVALFALIFKYVPVAPVAFFTAYIAVQMVVWFAPLIMVYE